MAQRGPHPLLFLTLVLLAAGWAQLSEGSGYFDFVDRHQDKPKTFAFDDRHYCDIMMKRRGLTHPSCEPTNSFIHSTASQLQDICSHTGTHVSATLYDSKASFNVTTCRVLYGSVPLDGKYRVAIGNTEIHVACLWWLPVRLEPTYLP
ncbi:ribonuclease-like [Chelydra serpentina]|uniref:Ribonuclease-like n=1 Tax=Chelydra serpentina TaxID=8475 RepID=A0A8T1S6E7_CHESE|nr:ribonuclease-like [Chelydra serpentina]